MDTQDDTEDQLDDGQKVGDELCEEEFERFADTMDLDVDLRGMDDEDRASFFTAKRILIKAMRSGALIINEAGEPVYTPQIGKNLSAIRFPEPEGGQLMAQDRKKEGHDMAKTIAVLSEMTGQNPARFGKMKNRDMKVCQAILALFIG